MDAADSRHPEGKARPRTFFIIGSNAAANPDLVQRIYDEGHDVGNHTYTHPTWQTRRKLASQSS